LETIHLPRNHTPRRRSSSSGPSPSYTGRRASTPGPRSGTYFHG
jgi:hypothetical protein